MDIKEDITETIVEKVLGDNAKVEITYISPTPINTLQPTPEETEETTSNNVLVTDDTNKVENGTWPKEIPSEVPMINLKLVNKMKTPNGIILDFGEVEKITVIQYSNRLKNDKYKTTREEIDDKKIEAIYEKNNIVANLSWYKDGAFTLMLTWD
jgi:hypothetical protein